MSTNSADQHESVSGRRRRGFRKGHASRYVPDEIDQDYAALLMTLTFFASSKLPEAYCAEIAMTIRTDHGTICIT